MDCQLKIKDFNGSAHFLIPVAAAKIDGQIRRKEGEQVLIEKMRFFLIF